MAGVEHDDDAAYIAAQDAYNFIEIGHTQARGKQVGRRRGVWQKIVAAGSEILHAMTGHENKDDVIRARLTQEAFHVVEDAFAGDLIIGQDESLHLTIQATTSLALE